MNIKTADEIADNVRIQYENKNWVAVDDIETLYFQDGLEDIRFLYELNQDALEKWCKTKGERICQIIFHEILMIEKPQKNDK